MAADRRQRASAAVQRVAPIELHALADGHLLHQALRDAELVNQIVAEHFHAALGDRAHRELGMSGHAELAHEEDVERRVQPFRHLAGDGHAASGQTQDDDIGAIRVAREVRGELAARVFAIEEAHRATLLKRSRAHAARSSYSGVSLCEEAQTTPTPGTSSAASLGADKFAPCGEGLRRTGSADSHPGTSVRGATS